MGMGLADAPENSANADNGIGGRASSKAGRRDGLREQIPQYGATVQEWQIYLRIRQSGPGMNARRGKPIGSHHAGVCSATAGLVELTRAGGKTSSMLAECEDQNCYCMLHSDEVEVIRRYGVFRVVKAVASEEWRYSSLPKRLSPSANLHRCRSTTRTSRSSGCIRSGSRSRYHTLILLDLHSVPFLFRSVPSNRRL
jgi:hypothetical protein